MFKLWNPFKRKEDEIEEALAESALTPEIKAGEEYPPETILELADKLIQPESSQITTIINKDFCKRFLTKHEQYYLSNYFAFVETIRFHLAKVGYDPLKGKEEAKPIIAKPFVFLNLSASVGGALLRAIKTQTLRMEKEKPKRGWLI